MPYPIIPINEMQAQSVVFGTPATPEQEFSDLQSLFLGNSIIKEAAKVSFNEKTITLLEAIDKNEDMVQTAVQAMSTGSGTKVCSVPTAISDSNLLSLKADGFVSGYGRSVIITDKGRIALRDYYLKSNNQIKQGKTKDKFDYSSEILKFKKAGIDNE